MDKKEAVHEKGQGLKTGKVYYICPEGYFGFVRAQDEGNYLFCFSVDESSHPRRLPRVHDWIRFEPRSMSGGCLRADPWWFADVPNYETVQMALRATCATVPEGFMDRFPFLKHLLATDALALLPGKYPVAVYALSGLDQIANNYCRTSFFPGDPAYDVLIAVRRSGEFVPIRSSIKMHDGYEVRAPSIGAQLEQIDDLSAVVYADASTCLLTAQRKKDFTGPFPPIMIFCSSVV